MGENKFGKTVGEVQIADEVVSAIAGLAALEVEGGDEIIGKLSDTFSAKNAYKKVKIQVDGADVYVDMAIQVKYGYSIPDITKQIQEKIIASLKNMVGLTCKEVNIRVVGVNTSQRV